MSENTTAANNGTPANKVKKFTMTMPQRMRLMDWLRVRFGDGTLANMDRNQMAEGATKDLGFTATPDACANVCVSLGWPYKKRSSIDAGKNRWAVKTIRDDVDRLRRDLDAVRLEIDTRPAAGGDPAVKAAVEKLDRNITRLFGWLDVRLTVLEKKFGLVRPARPDVE